MDHEHASAGFDRNLRSRVERRISFLLQEAQHGSPRDHAITFAMRAVSNYFTVGRDAQSFTIKKLNRNVSSGALELLMLAINFEDWASKTINEHPKPLADTWNWLLSQAERLSVAEVWSHFEENPMITITRDEDDELVRRKLRASAAEDRYPQVGIRTLVLKYPPVEAFRLRDFTTADLRVVSAD